jgi:hypothetical protein
MAADELRKHLNVELGEGPASTEGLILRLLSARVIAARIGAECNSDPYPLDSSTSYLSVLTRAIRDLWKR